MLLMKDETRSFYELAVQRAVERVVESLDGALDLQALARGIGLSPFHFHRIFRGLIGETPLELHRRLRLERAAWSLLADDAPVTQIAFTAGYETHESFTRAFGLHYGCSPSDFRQSRDGQGAARPFRIPLGARSGVHFEPQRTAPPRIHFISGDSAMHVEIKHLQELRVASLRHIGPYNRISEACARLGEIATAAGIVDDSTLLLAIYHDDPETTPAAELHSEAAIRVSPDARIPAELGERRIAAGRYAVTTHLGPYEQLGDVWPRFLGEWLPRSGERMSDGVSFEIYRNTPAEVPPPELRTELYIPLV
jgi:AraC family transcriptional regulator